MECSIGVDAMDCHQDALGLIDRGTGVQCTFELDRILSRIAIAGKADDRVPCRSREQISSVRSMSAPTSNQGLCLPADLVSFTQFFDLTVVQWVDRPGAENCQYAAGFLEFDCCGHSLGHRRFRDDWTMILQQCRPRR